jgi:hypothetical protein
LFHVVASPAHLCIQGGSVASWMCVLVSTSLHCFHLMLWSHLNASLLMSLSLHPIPPSHSLDYFAITNGKHINGYFCHHDHDGIDAFCLARFLLLLASQPPLALHFLGILAEFDLACCVLMVPPTFICSTLLTCAINLKTRTMPILLIALIRRRCDRKLKLFPYHLHQHYPHLCCISHLFAMATFRVNDLRPAHPLPPDTEVGRTRHNLTLSATWTQTIERNTISLT